MGSRSSLAGAPPKSSAIFVMTVGVVVTPANFLPPRKFCVRKMLASGSEVRPKICPKSQQLERNNFWRKPPTETPDLPTSRRGQVASALDYMHSRGVIHCDLNLAHDDILLGPGVKTKTHHMFDLDVEVRNWGTVYNKNYLS